LILPGQLDPMQTGAHGREGDPPDAPGLERAIQRALAGDDLPEAWRLVGRRLAL
jgi:hypothetical protein